MARDFFRTTLTRTLASGAIEALAGVDVTLYYRNPDGSQGAQAPVYDGPTTGVQIAQPMRTAADGIVQFYAEAGAYLVAPRDVTANPPRIDNTKFFPWNSVPGDAGGIPLTQVESNIPSSKLAAAAQAQLWMTGDIKPTGKGITPGVNEPSGWLLCNGQAVPRTTYADLWNAIRDGHAGTGGDPAPFGNGDGATTFNVPDFQGRVPFGRAIGGRNEVNAVGRNDGFSLGFRSPSHKHSLPALGMNGSGTHSHETRFTRFFDFAQAVPANRAAFDAQGGSGGGAVTPYGVWSEQNGNHTHTFTGNVGPNDGNLLTDTFSFIVVNYLIKT